MNKRNTVLAVIVLAVLVILLVGKNRFHHRVTYLKEVHSNQVDYLLDLNLATGFDSATVKAFDLPIVVHYPKVTNVNGSHTKLHIFSLTPEVLKSLASPDREGFTTDSTKSIHIYPKVMSSMNSSVNLVFYNKRHMKEEVRYVVTYPVRDSTGLHVVEDSGIVSTEYTWKSYGTGTKSKGMKDSERAMTEQLEKSLIRDVAKKIKPD